MKVLLISPFAKPDMGGVESHIEKLIAEILKKGFKVTLLTFMPLNSDERPPTYENNGELEIIRIRWFGQGLFRRLEGLPPLNILYLLPPLLLRGIFLSMQRRGEYEVMHVHGLISAIAGIIFQKILRVRCVVSTHAIYGLKSSAFYAKFIRRIFNSYDQILTVGEPSSLELKGLGVDPKKICIHPNWVDLNKYNHISVVEARELLGIDPDEFLVLFVGRMIGIKGELILLEVAKRPECQNIRFIFIGSGPEQSKLLENEKSFPNINVFIGLSDFEKDKFLKAASIFCSPVLYDEGFATVYLESIASGVPVITADRGCLPYFLTEDVAELIDPINVETLAEVILKYYKNKPLLEIKKNNCIRYAKKNFSTKNSKVILNAYKG